MESLPNARRLGLCKDIVPQNASLIAYHQTLNQGHIQAMHVHRIASGLSDSTPILHHKCSTLHRICCLCGSRSLSTSAVAKRKSRQNPANKQCEKLKRNARERAARRKETQEEHQTRIAHRRRRQVERLAQRHADYARRSFMIPPTQSMLTAPVRKRTDCDGQYREHTTAEHFIVYNHFHAYHPITSSSHTAAPALPADYQPAGILLSVEGTDSSTTARVLGLVKEPTDPVSNARPR